MPVDGNPLFVFVDYDQNRESLQLVGVAAAVIICTLYTVVDFVVVNYC